MPIHDFAEPATPVALLTNDPCGVTSATSTAAIAINNLGTGRVTASAQLLQVAETVYEQMLAPQTPPPR